MGGTSESSDNTILWAASLTTFFSFCRAGETTVPTEDLYDLNSHLSYNDIDSTQATHVNTNTGSPPIVTQWIQMLQDHPDKGFTKG